MHDKTKLKFRNLLVAGLFIFLFVASEIAYEIKNPYYFTEYFNSAGEYFLSKNSYKPALFFLDLTSAVHTYVTSTRFPRKVHGLIFQKKLQGINKPTQDELLKLAKDRVGNIKEENNIQNLTNFYYHSGLLLYEKGYKESASGFFKTAINLNPEMSFLFLELADLEFDSNQKAEALSTLSYCLEFEPAKENCQTFLNQYFESKTFPEVGHYSSLIDEFHSKK